MLNPLPSLLISTASPSVALGLRKDPSVPHPRLDSILGLRSAKVPGRVSQPRHHPWVEGGGGFRKLDTGANGPGTSVWFQCLRNRGLHTQSPCHWLYTHTDPRVALKGAL